MLLGNLMAGCSCVPGRGCALCSKCPRGAELSVRSARSAELSGRGVVSHWGHRSVRAGRELYVGVQICQ